MKITSIHTSIANNGHYQTVIYYLDSTANMCMAEQENLHLQGVEEFIRNFRIKHKL